MDPVGHIRNHSLRSLEVDHLAPALPDALFQAPDADAIDLLHLLRHDRPKVLYQVQVRAVRWPVLDDVGKLLREHLHGCPRSMVWRRPVGRPIPDTHTSGGE